MHAVSFPTGNSVIMPGVHMGIRSISFACMHAATMHLDGSACASKDVWGNANDESYTVAEALPLRLKHNPKTLILKHAPILHHPGIANMLPVATPRVTSAVQATAWHNQCMKVNQCMSVEAKKMLTWHAAAKLDLCSITF